MPIDKEHLIDVIKKAALSLDDTDAQKIIDELEFAGFKVVIAAEMTNVPTPNEESHEGPWLYLGAGPFVAKGPV